MKTLFLVLVEFLLLSYHTQCQVRKKFELYPINFGIGVQYGSDQVIGNRFASDVLECNYVFKNQLLVGIGISGTSFKDATDPNAKFGLLFPERAVYQISVWDLHFGKIFRLNSLDADLELISGIGALSFGRPYYFIKPQPFNCLFYCNIPTYDYEYTNSYTVPLSARICFDTKKRIGPAITVRYFVSPLFSYGTASVGLYCHFSRHKTNKQNN
jgi:hypothetical protein